MAVNHFETSQTMKHLIIAVSVDGLAPNSTNWANVDPDVDRHMASLVAPFTNMV